MAPFNSHLKMSWSAKSERNRILAPLDFLECGKESDHLKQINLTNKAQVKSKAYELKEEGHSNVKIAQELGVSEGAVRKWLKQLEIED